MLESLVSSENLSLNSIDMSLLERLKWLQQDQVVCQSNHNSLQFHGSNNDELLLLQTTLNHFQMLGSNEFLPNYNIVGFGPTHEAIDGCISRTSSCHIEQVDTMEVMLKNNEENKGITTLKKKRKSEVKEKNDKKIKVEAETEQSLKGKSNISKTDQESSETTKDGLENQKLDYIHVRARRGQATDRHSLAERARREKISKKMKYLQDLVPGCNKITGKAGMLDEIINYVQSLQRQVEFLSMKISLLNPEIELGIEENSLKQFQAYSIVSSKPSIMVNTPLFPLDQQGSLDLSLINPNQTTSIEAPSSSWEKTQSQSLFNTSSLGFQY